MQTSLIKLLSASKEDAKYIQANIKNSLSRDNREKSAECTSLVNARSKNTVSPSRDLILIFTVKC